MPPKSAAKRKASAEEPKAWKRPARGQRLIAEKVEVVLEPVLDRAGADFEHNFADDDRSETSLAESRDRFVEEYYNDFGEKKEYGVTRLWADVLADGNKVGAARLTHVPRGRYFADALEAYSEELLEVGAAFFSLDDEQFKFEPKLPGVRTTLVARKNLRGQEHAFLYLHSLWFDRAATEKYDMMDLGTRALRSLLIGGLTEEVSEIELLWDVCVYFPDTDYHEDTEDDPKDSVRCSADMCRQCGFGESNDLLEDGDKTLFYAVSQVKGTVTGFKAD